MIFFRKTWFRPAGWVSGYRRIWALRDCALAILEGRVTPLVGCGQDYVAAPGGRDARADRRHDRGPWPVSGGRAHAAGQDTPVLGQDHGRRPPAPPQATFNWSSPPMQAITALMEARIAARGLHRAQCTAESRGAGGTVSPA